MSSFSSNFQFNIAQMGSLAKEQDKVQANQRRVQENVAHKIEKMEQEQHNEVQATAEHEDTRDVKDNNPHNQEDESRTNNASEHIEKEEVLKNEKHLIFKDEEKGKVIDFSG